MQLSTSSPTSSPLVRSMHLWLTSSLGVRGSVARHERDVQGPRQRLRHESFASASGPTRCQHKRIAIDSHHQNVALLNDNVGVFLSGSTLNAALDSCRILGLSLLFKSGLFGGSGFLLTSFLQPCFFL